MCRIGVCRALDGLRFLDVWQPFLSGLGLEVVVSEPTDRAMIETGARLAPAELCLPAKVFLGHALSLVGHIDVMFVPRLVCRSLTDHEGRQDMYFGCPKAMALPDMVRALIPGLPPMVEFLLDEREQSEAESYRLLARELSRRQRTSRKSEVGNQKSEVAERKTGIRAAVSRLSSVNHRTRQPSSASRIGVVGHDYLLDDESLSLGILSKLESLGVEPIRDSAAPALVRPAFMPNWMFEKELIEAALRLAGDETVEGLALATSFACGTSAVTNELIRRAAAHVRPELSVLTVMFDEHTAEAGLLTRLESFVDLIRMRERRGERGEGRSQKSEVRNQNSGDGGWRTE